MKQDVKDFTPLLISPDILQNRMFAPRRPINKKKNKKIGSNILLNILSVWPRFRSHILPTSHAPFCIFEIWFINDCHGLSAAWPICFLFPLTSYPTSHDFGGSPKKYANSLSTSYCHLGGSQHPINILVPRAEENAANSTFLMTLGHPNMSNILSTRM